MIVVIVGKGGTESSKVQVHRIIGFIGDNPLWIALYDSMRLGGVWSRKSLGMNADLDQVCSIVKSMWVDAGLG